MKTAHSNLPTVFARRTKRKLIQGIYNNSGKIAQNVLQLFILDFLSIKDSFANAYSIEVKNVSEKNSKKITRTGRKLSMTINYLKLISCSDDDPHCATTVAAAHE